MSKLEIMLNNGKKYSFHEIQCHFRNYIHEPLWILSQGLLPNGLPPNPRERSFFTEVIEAMSSVNLDNSGKNLKESIVNLLAKASLLDKEKYKRLAEPEKGNYARRFGSEFAYEFQKIMVGYKDPTGCVSITNYEVVFQDWTKNPDVKDPKHPWLSWPMGLFRD